MNRSRKQHYSKPLFYKAFRDLRQAFFLYHRVLHSGGADEPTVILYSDSNQANLHVACSALHFKPVSDDTEWRIEFNIIRSSKKTFLLI